MSSQFDITRIFNPSNLPVLLAYLVFIVSIVILMQGLKGIYGGEVMKSIGQIVVSIFMCIGLITFIYKSVNDNSE